MTSGLDIHFGIDEAEGASAGMVVLAGSLGSTAAMWEPQVGPLAECFRVVRYDTRGHGRSPVPPGPYRIDDLADDLLRLLDRLEVDRAHLVGLSLGGMTAMRVAARNPDRVDRLAVLCTSALLGPAEDWRDRASMVLSDGTAAIADRVVGRWFTDEFAHGNPLIIDSHRSMIASTPPGGYAGCCLAIAEMDLRADLAAIAAPTLVIAGAQDPATPPEQLQAIAAGIAGARFEILDPGAHLVSAERPDAVNRLLLEHLAGEVGASRPEAGDR